VAGATDAFEEHVATPTGLDAERIAELFGLDYTAPADSAAFAQAVTHALGAPRTTLVHVRTDRKANVAEHRAVWEAVRNRV
jgi:2-succinyl-5-enolpyruvyl-6-hydroxy-3-cyclohexene-1-carboxylate synthase